MSSQSSRIQIGDWFVGLEQPKVQEDHRPIEHFARGREAIAGQHVGPAVAAVVLDAQRPEAAEPLIGPRGHVRRVRSVPHANDRRDLGRAEDRRAKVVAVGGGLVPRALGIRVANVAHRLGHLDHARRAVGVHREPVAPIAVVFEVAFRQQSVFEHFLAVNVGLLRDGPLPLDPLDRLEHARQRRLEPVGVPSVEIVLGQGPQDGAVVQPVARSRVIVLLVDAGAVKHAVVRLGVIAGKRSRALQLGERLEILPGALGIAEGIQQEHLKAALVRVDLVAIARRGHHVEAALRVLRGADVDVGNDEPSQVVEFRFRRRESRRFGDQIAPVLRHALPLGVVVQRLQRRRVLVAHVGDKRDARLEHLRAAGGHVELANHAAVLGELAPGLLGSNENHPQSPGVGLAVYAAPRQDHFLPRLDAQRASRSRRFRSRITNSQPHHEHGRRLFAAIGMVWVERAAQQRGERFLLEAKPVMLPAVGDDRQAVFGDGHGCLVVFAVVRLRGRADPLGADAKSDRVVPPLQSLEFGALRLGSAFADEDVATVLDGELLPTRVGRHRQIDLVASLANPRILRRNLPRGPLERLLGLLRNLVADLLPTGRIVRRKMARIVGSRHQDVQVGHKDRTSLQVKRAERERAGQLAGGRVGGRADRDHRDVVRSRRRGPRGEDFGDHALGTRRPNVLPCPRRQEPILLVELPRLGRDEDPVEDFQASAPGGGAGSPQPNSIRSASGSSTESDDISSDSTFAPAGRTSRILSVRR